MKQGLIAIGALGVVAGMGLSLPAAAAPTCPYDGRVKFAGLNWASNSFHVAVASRILKAGYGCKTESVPGSTIPLMNGLGKGDVHVMMELWKDNVIQIWTKIKKRGQAQELPGASIPDAVQGWFVPRYMVEGDAKRGIKPIAPGLKSVSDLPKYKHLFKDPEQPSKGRFYNCMLGWGCETVNTKKFAAYEMGKHYVNYRTGSGAALAAAIASAYVRGKPVLAYYWGPTWVLGKYDMVMLKEAPYEKETWEKLTKSKTGKGLKATAYPVVKVVVAVNSKFAKKAPALVTLLSKYQLPGKVVDEALVYMRENKDKDGSKAARNFFAKHPDIWTKWVSADAAARIKASLK